MILINFFSSLPSAFSRIFCLGCSIIGVLEYLFPEKEKKGSQSRKVLVYKTINVFLALKLIKTTGNVGPGGSNPSMKSLRGCLDRDNAFLSFKLGWCGSQGVSQPQFSIPKLSMAVLPFRLLVPLSCAASVSASPSCMENVNLNCSVSKSSHGRVSATTVSRFSRRMILQFLGLNHMICFAFPALAAPPIMPDMKEPEVIRTLKLPSGVRIQDIVEGEGPEAHGGDLVEFNYVCRRSNGYFVHSTVDQFSGESKPVILPLDENQMIVGLKEVLTGMRVGGKRRALIPPSVGYVNENLKPIPEEFGPRRSLFSHAKEPLIFEVQILKIESSTTICI